MATVIRNIHGETFTLEERPDAARSALEGDGALVICQRPKIDILPNSVNEVQAREVWGNLGFTTWEFVKKEIVMSAVSLRSFPHSFECVMESPPPPIAPLPLLPRPFSLALL